MLRNGGQVTELQQNEMARWPSHNCLAVWPLRRFAVWPLGCLAIVWRVATWPFGCLAIVWPSRHCLAVSPLFGRLAMHEKTNTLLFKWQSTLSIKNLKRNLIDRASRMTANTSQRN